MEQTNPLFTRLFTSVGGKLNLFLILSAAPLPILFYFNPLSAVIPLYGFLLLLIKRRKFPTFKEAAKLQKIIGLVILIGSFFAYFAIAQIYPKVAFYSNANYAAYILGLFLAFFEFKALKESFSPLVLVTATTSMALMSQLLEPFISPYTNDVVHLVVGILKLVGINASIYYYVATPIIAFPSISGATVTGAFTYGCIGIYSMLVFSLILVVILFEDPSSHKTKLAYTIIGLTGTFALNILRITIIFVTDYFYGMEAGGTIHYIIGYALFSAWLVTFLYAYSRKQAIHAGFVSIWRRIAQHSKR